MPINPAVQRFVADAHDWRRDIHQHPELDYDVPRTASFVAERLRAFGCDEVATGVGRTGVVGVIRGRGAASARPSACAPTWTRCRSTRRPICPIARRSPARCTPAATTAIPRCCSAPRAISPRRRNFRGTARVIFQPAEEGGAGAKAMLDDGLMETFRASRKSTACTTAASAGRQVRDPQGRGAWRPADRFDHQFEGRGGHAALPHPASIPYRRGAQIVTRCRRSLARNVDPLEFLRRLGRPLRRRHDDQHHSADRAAPRHRAHAVARRRAICSSAAHRDRDRGRRRLRASHADVDYRRGYPVDRQSRRTRPDFAVAIARRRRWRQRWTRMRRR